MHNPYILQVCGLKNTGKTTFMNEFTTYLSKKGYRVGTIKHDGHDFKTEQYTEDNFQHYHAGAIKSAVFSNNQYLMIQRETKTLEQFLEEFCDMDIILIEGCKNERYPKVEMLRKGISEVPVSNHVGRLACIVDEVYDIKERCFLRHDTDLFDKLIKLFF